jgi:hypothetical protein
MEDPRIIRRESQVALQSTVHKNCEVTGAGRARVCFFQTNGEQVHLPISGKERLIAAVLTAPAKGS